MTSGPAVWQSRLASPRCSATRTAPSLIENFAAVSLIEALSTAIDCSTSRWRCGKRVELRCDLARRGGLLRRLARQRLGEIVDVDEDPPAAAAQRIDQLVAGDRKQPGRERRFASQVCRFRCTANKISCTISSA